MTASRCFNVRLGSGFGKEKSHSSRCWNIPIIILARTANVPDAGVASFKERQTMKHQMELTLANAAPTSRRAHRRLRRLPSAHWWFDQMRKAVDDAMDWQAAPPARPEQTSLLLTGGRMRAA